jgi:uncharacterized protein DUF4230
MRFGNKFPQRRRLPQTARAIRRELSNGLQAHEPILVSNPEVQSGKILPALHSAELNYISVMRQLKQIFWLAATLFIFFTGVWLGFKLMHWTKSGSGLHEENTVTVVEQIQTLSDLVTVKYVLEKVVVLEDAKWYGENRVLLLAHGIVKAGIDLKRLKPEDVTITGKKITIHLPLPQITDAYLDDQQTRVIDHTTGLLRSFDKDLEQTARANAVDDIRRAARLNGILEDADDRAQLELAVFLHQAGFERVEFTGINPSPLLNPTREDVP